MDALALVTDEEALFQHFCDLRREVVQRKREASDPLLTLQDRQLLVLTNGEPDRKRTPSPEPVDDELDRAIAEARREQAKLVSANSGVVCLDDIKQEAPNRRRPRGKRKDGDPSVGPRSAASSGKSVSSTSRWQPRRQREAEPVYISHLTAEEKTQERVNETLKELLKLGDVLDDGRDDAAGAQEATSAQASQGGSAIGAKLISTHAPPKPPSEGATIHRPGAAARVAPEAEEKPEEQSTSDDEMQLKFSGVGSLPQGWSAEGKRRKREQVAA